jgi:hypothetical protein
MKIVITKLKSQDGLIVSDGDELKVLNSDSEACAWASWKMRSNYKFLLNQVRFLFDSGYDSAEITQGEIYGRNIDYSKMFD